MKKMFSILAASALLLSLLSACGQRQGSVPSTAPSAAPSENTGTAPAPSASPDAGPTDGASITTNGGEVITLSALEHQAESGSTVYYRTSRRRPWWRYMTRWSGRPQAKWR